VNTIDHFIDLVGEQTGLPVTIADAERPLDQVPGWDSLHLVSLLSIMERRTGRPVSLPAVLEAGTLAEIYRLAVDRDAA
jgi:acyl carrier protein